MALTFWGEYHVSVWCLNKKNLSSIEKNCAIYSEYSKTCQIYERKILSNPDLDVICEGLVAWEKITPFLNIVEYESDAHYALSISEYKVNLQAFYEAGENSFLQPKDVKGDGETFYCRTLCFYMLQFAKETWDKHRLGLGIYTMQGFERRNKESKNTFRRFTNKKGNCILSSLRWLWELFHYEHVGV